MQKLTTKHGPLIALQTQSSSFVGVRARTAIFYPLWGGDCVSLSCYSIYHVNGVVPD